MVEWVTHSRDSTASRCRCRRCWVCAKAKNERKLRRIISFILFSGLFNRINIKWHDNTTEKNLNQWFNIQVWVSCFVPLFRSRSRSPSPSPSSFACAHFLGNKFVAMEHQSTTWNTANRTPFGSNEIGLVLQCSHTRSMLKYAVPQRTEHTANWIRTIKKVYEEWTTCGTLRTLAKKWYSWKRRPENKNSTRSKSV